MSATRAPEHDPAGAAAVTTVADADELAALREIVQLGTTAPTWDELMQLIVDRSTVAMGAEVCSLYLVDRDRGGLTLAATNGVDRQHVGVARLAIGQGITGIAAESRGPVVSTDLANDPRCAWIRGVDHERFTSILAVPLSIGDRVIGVLNVKTEARREFPPGEVRRLSTIASLLAGVVERRRLHLETEAQLDALRSIDQARAELIAVVTHQLRTPLAVVRAYLDLLAEAAGDRNAEVAGWHAAATGQVARLDELVSTILDTVRADRLLTIEVEPFAVGGVIDEVLTRLAPLLRRHRLERYEEGEHGAVGDPARLAQVLELLLENAAKYAPEGATVVVADWAERDEVHVAVGDDGPGIPAELRESVFEPFVRLDESGGRPGSGVGLFAARRLTAAMGGRLWIEDKMAGGSQFVIALPAAKESR
jgi:signal transduction histidine kinase